jgi:glucuronate isomerase
VWEKASAMLAGEDLRVWGIFEEFSVKAVCTTDDPVDDLPYHKQIAAAGIKTRVYPAFRPDKALNVHLPELFNPWVEKLAAAANIDITNFQRFLDALKQRHDYFHSMGSRLSDHGLNHCYADFCGESEAAAIFAAARQGQAAAPEQQTRFASFLMLLFGRWDAEKGWTKQLHVGAHRSNSTRMFKLLGPDTGFDSMGDWRQVDTMIAYMDKLDQENALPKTIVYNNNPVDNYALATLIGNFQDGSIPGKIQFGSGWWFLDQKEGMEMQMNALSNCGLLSRFVGMLTDSRSFMSYPRHEYFRRTLCNLIGRDIENGEIPDNDELVGPMVRNICYGNVKDYLGLDL